MSIVEIPIDSAAEEPEEPEAMEEVAEEAPKRGRGRPKGACNKKKPREMTPEPPEPPSPPPAAKTKAKPRKPAAPVEKRAKKKVIVYESSSSEEEAVQEPDTHRIASEVLAMLSSQRATQRDQRRNRYASWFQNM